MKKIRILIGTMGMDQHEVGAITVSRMLMEAGMEVVYTGRFNTPKKMVTAGIEEGVDVIGVSCHSWEYLYFIPELLESINRHDAGIPVIVGGSVITPKDEAELKKMGVAAVFGSGSVKDEVVASIQKLVENKTRA
ncbi:MAG: cobalamin-dependent protein [Desulfobacterales bacterium]